MSGPSRLILSLFASGAAALAGSCSVNTQAAAPTTVDTALEPGAGFTDPNDPFVQRWSYLSAQNQIEETATKWDGERDGAVTLWHDNNTKSGEGSYDHGRREGEWTFWHPNGHMRWKGAYRRDELHGPEQIWYPNDQRQSEGSWKDGERHGVFTTWHENGVTASQGEYRNGKREGRFLYFRPDGSPDAELSGRYSNDVKVGD